MKKLIMAAVLSSVLLVNGAFANKPSDKITYKVETAFNKEFVKAKEVNWQKTNTYYKAEFKIDNELVNAYFTHDGELLGTIRNLLSTQLPVNLQTSIKKDYTGYWITELFELSKEDGTGYFITVQNADQSITLQSTDGYSWSTYSRTKKQ